MRTLKCNTGACRHLQAPASPRCGGGGAATPCRGGHPRLEVAPLQHPNARLRSQRRPSPSSSLSRPPQNPPARYGSPHPRPHLSGRRRHPGDHSSLPICPMGLCSTRWGSWTFERCVWRAACCLTMWSMVLDNRSGSLRARHVLPDCRRCSPPLLPPLPQRWCPSALRRCAAALGCCERQMCSSTASQPQTLQLHG